MITFNATKKTITFERLKDAVDFMRQYMGEEKPIVVNKPTPRRKKTQKAVRHSQFKWDRNPLSYSAPRGGILRTVAEAIYKSDKPLMSGDITNQTKISLARVQRAVSFLYIHGIVERTNMRYPSKYTKSVSSYYRMTPDGERLMSKVVA